MCTQLQIRTLGICNTVHFEFYYHVSLQLNQQVKKSSQPLIHDNHIPANECLMLTDNVQFSELK